MLFRSLVILGLATRFLGAGVIHLKTRDIDTAVERVAPGERPARRLDPARRHMIVEFAAPWTHETLAALAQRGAVVTSVIGSRAVVVSALENLNLQGLGVDWTGLHRATDKLSPQLNKQASAHFGSVVDFHSDVKTAVEFRIALESGVSIVPQASVLPHQLVVIGTEAQFRALSQWDEVAYIFPASAALLAGDVVFPCEGALVSGQNAAQFVTTNTGWVPDGLAGVTLNYVFTTLTTQLPQNQVQSQIVQAMRTWSGVADVQFAEGTDPAAPSTVAIEFGTQVNGDPTPFTSTNILAHTYYPAPPNPEPIAGDLHFNPMVAWHIGSSVDIYTVSLHELGHALGLGHTDDPSDVMYPYYQYGVPLSGNDIAGVRSLYGAAPAAPPVISGPAVPAQPLIILVSAPLNGMQTTASSVNLTGTIVNASGGVMMGWLSSSGASGQAAGGSSWSAADVPLNPGINVITLTATDGSLRTASQVVRVVRSGTSAAVDLSAGPSIAITSPQPGSAAASDSITVTGTASDPAGISAVTWGTSGGATGTATGTSSWTAPAIPLFAGENVIVIRATNEQGATDFKSLIVINK